MRLEGSGLCHDDADAHRAFVFTLKEGSDGVCEGRLHNSNNIILGVYQKQQLFYRSFNCPVIASIFVASAGPTATVVCVGTPPNCVSPAS